MSNAQKQIEQEEQRRRNREMFPEMSKVIDEFRAVFGEGCKVMYVKEGEREAGSPVEGEWVPITPGDGYVGGGKGRGKAGGVAGKVGGVRKGFR